MGLFASAGQAWTFDFRGGDAGYVPFAMGHCVENTDARVLALFGDIQEILL
jgi:oxalate decarboxylase